MTSVTESWKRLWETIEGSPARVIRAIAIPPDRVKGDSLSATAIAPGEHYFAVVINELFLAEGRQWFTTYDPLVFVVAEFGYDGQSITVPAIVGPSMLKGKVQEVPHGMALTDTEIAGPHPYVGGKLAITVVLAQVKRDKYVSRLLDVIENVGSAFAVGTALGPYLKVARPVIAGVESVFGSPDTKALAGHRWEYNDGITPWLKPGFFALVNEDEQAAKAVDLRVKDGRLLCGENGEGYRNSDFVLYSLRSLTRRSDERLLPFYPLFQQTLREAARVEDGSWDRAKAMFVTLYQQVLTSPDLTWKQVQEITDGFRGQLLEVRERVKLFATLGKAVGVGLESGRPEAALAGPYGKERMNRLESAQDLLRL